MIPAAFANFFTASASAGAALVGLLFVAIAVSPERIFSQDAPTERRAVATSAFTALANALFVSFAALIPDTTLAYVAMAFSVVSLIATVRLGVSLVARGLTVKRLIRRLSLVVLSGVLYSLEGWSGFQLLTSPQISQPVYTLAGLLLGIYGMALVRAWELLGAERQGLLAWLSPMHDLQPPLDRATPSSPPPLHPRHPK